MPDPATKIDTDKFSHHVDSEPKRDNKDYGPDDDFMEIVSSQAPADGEPLGDTGGENYSSDGPGSTMDVGGENYSQDIVHSSEKKAEPAPDSKDGENTEESTSDDVKPDAKKKSPAAKRIDEVIADRNKAREEAAYYKGLAEGKARTGTPPEDAAEVVEPATDKPKLADFESYEEYQEAFHDFKDSERDRKNKADNAKTAADQTRTDLSARLKEGAGKYDDFETVANNPNLAVNDTMVEAIAESDNPADIAYHLGKNPDQAMKIAGLSAVAAGREIAKIDAKFGTGKTTATKPTKTVSTAPDPIEPVNTGNKDVATAKTPENMNMEEFINWRTKGGKRRV